MGFYYNEDRFQSLISSLPVEGAKRLVHYLEIDNKGNPAVYRTPLYKEGKEYPSYEGLIGLLEERVGYSDFDELNKVDAEAKDSIGPFGPQKPFPEVADGLEEFMQQQFNPDEAIWERAVEIVSQLLPTSSLRPMAIDASYDLMPKGTSLGCPWVTSDKSYLPDYLRRAVNLKSKDDIYPFIQYTRIQPKGLDKDPKYRFVWGSDHVDTIAFARLLYPMLNALRRLPGFSAWLRAEDVDVEATRILNSAKGRPINSADYSHYDSSLHRRAIDGARFVMKKWFVSSIHWLIDLAFEHMLTTPLIVPFAVLEGRDGGMPSGTVLTNMVDSLVNLIAGVYCALRNNTSLEDFMVLGDDSVFLFGTEIPSEVIAATMSEIGLTCNPEKQWISTRSILYLQRWHSLDYAIEGICHGVHSPYRSASGLFGQERWASGWNEYMHTARWVMQVENCVWHPKFNQLVTFVYNGDKVLLSGVDPLECFRRAGGSAKIREVLHISSFPFNSKNPDLASKFRTVELIRKLQGGDRI